MFLRYSLLPHRSTQAAIEAALVLIKHSCIKDHLLHDTEFQKPTIPTIPPACL